ncbi:MAG: hypothetical protein WCY41_06120 [Candidatus Micrarchaeia archaeon]
MEMAIGQKIETAGGGARALLGAGKDTGNVKGKEERGTATAKGKTLSLGLWGKEGPAETDAAIQPHACAA